MKRFPAIVASLLASCALVAPAAGAGGYFEFFPLVAKGGDAEGGIACFNLAGAPASAAVQLFDGSAPLLNLSFTIPAMAPAVLPFDGVPAIPPFEGSAVMSADQPFGGVYREVDGGSTPGAPMYSSGVAAGATTIFLPVAVRTRALTTTIGVQNAGVASVTAALAFRAGSATPVLRLETAPIPPGAAAAVKLEEVAGLPRPFDGSVVITAAGPIVATAKVLAAGGAEAYAFEGQAAESTTLLVPEGLCVSSGGRTTSSRIAVQNAGADDARLAVTWLYPVTTKSGTTIRSVSSTSALTPPGGRRAFNPCGKRVLRGRKKVIAVVTGRTEADAPTQVAAVVRRQRTGDGTQSAYAALPVSGATTHVAFPVAGWADGAGERTTIDVMNALPAAGPLAAPVSVTATFHFLDGTVVPVPLTVTTRASVSDASAGALSDGSFRGFVLLESNAPIAAAATVRRAGTRASDGYAGIPLP